MPTARNVESLVSRHFPDRRQADHIDPTRPERRRFHTMDDKLAAEAAKQGERRFTGTLPTDWSDL